MSGRAVRCDPGRTRPPGSVLHVSARKRPEQRLPPRGSGPECRAGEYTSHIETDGPGDTVRGAGPVGRGAGLCGPGAPRLRDPGEDHANHEPAPPGARHSGSATVPAAHAPGPRSGLREGRPSHPHRPPLAPPAQRMWATLVTSRLFHGISASPPGHGKSTPDPLKVKRGEMTWPVTS